MQQNKLLKISFTTEVFEDECIYSIDKLIETVGYYCGAAAETLRADRDTLAKNLCIRFRKYANEAAHLNIPLIRSPLGFMLHIKCVLNLKYRQMRMLTGLPSGTPNIAPDWSLLREWNYTI